LNLFDDSQIFSLEKLGEGGFGVVQKAYNKNSNEFIAIKRGKVGGSEMMLENAILKNVEYIRQSKSGYQEYFLKYFGAFRDPKMKNVIILKIESGICTLEDVLEAGKIYTIPEIYYFFRKIVESFVILQENGIANRDVKTSNIILVEDQTDRNKFF